jgi:hypothetical protein
MQRFILPFHSFSDIITNSSTDVFACKTKKSLDLLEKMLAKMYFDSIDDDSGSIGDKIRNFKEHIATIKMTTLKNFYYSYEDWLNNEWSNEKQKTVKLYPTVKSFIKGQRYTFGEDAKEDDEIIEICGVDDNSIPYWLQNFIEYEIGGYRIHLG